MNAVPQCFVRTRVFRPGTRGIFYFIKSRSKIPLPSHGILRIKESEVEFRPTFGEVTPERADAELLGGVVPRRQIGDAELLGFIRRSFAHFARKKEIGPESGRKPDFALRRARTPRTEQTVDDERLWESLSDDVPLPLLDESEATDDQVERLRQALDRLRPDERVLLMLTYDEERPAAEVATIMGLSEGNIRTCLCRLRKKLFILLNHDSDPR